MRWSFLVYGYLQHLQSYGCQAHRKHSTLPCRLQAGCLSVGPELVSTPKSDNSCCQVDDAGTLRIRLDIEEAARANTGALSHACSALQQFVLVSRISEDTQHAGPQKSVTIPLICPGMGQRVTDRGAMSIWETVLSRQLGCYAHKAARHKVRV